jgi:hypothetical protein
MQIRSQVQQAASGLIIRQLRIAQEVPQGSDQIAPAAAPNMDSTQHPGIPRRRLSGPDRDIDERIWPVRKHWGDGQWEENWSLYWLPVKFSNKRDTVADVRFMDFFMRLLALFQTGPKLHEYSFIESQILHPYLLRRFVLDALEYFPLGAIGFRPEEGPSKMPDYDDAMSVDPGKTYKMLQEKQQNFGMEDVFPNAPPILYYLPAGHEKARQQMTGRGGYSYVLSKLNQTAFFEKTKEMLARNTDDEVLLRLPMVAPTLSAASFARAKRADLETWFSVLDLYVQESPRDKGVLIASNRCLDDEIAELVIAAQLNHSAWRKRFGLAVSRLE